MIHAALALAFIAIPISAWVVKRSIAWVSAAIIGGLAVAGALVSVSIDWGFRWTWTYLELLTLAVLVLVLGWSWVSRPDKDVRPALGPQFLAIGLPMFAVAAGIILSRLVAASSSGLFTGVGFFMRRIYAEDNAKWLDFSARLVQDGPITQSDPMGGPLQLFLVPIADILVAVSFLFMGGLNEVFVMSNTVIYGQFALAVLASVALAPIAERVFSNKSGNRRLPAPLVWAGVIPLTIASLAASGLGHLTLQFTFIVIAFWVAAFLVTSPSAIRSLASLAVVPLFFVWFPMAPVSAVVAIVAIAAAVVMLVRRHWNLHWGLSLMWVASIGLSASDLWGVLRFLMDNASATASAGFGAAGGVVAGVAANDLNLNFLASQGGTEQATAISGGLAAAGALGAALFLQRESSASSRWSTFTRYAPALVIVGYAAGLSVTGSWWAGDGPNYGALKTTYLVTFVILAVSLPLALRLIDAQSVHTNAPQWVAIGGVGILLSIDGIAPRAVIYASPEQWPSVIGEQRGYWWPAEVKTQAEQPIASLPVACAFWLDTTKAPTALPDGQPMYACTRILAGMNGADYEALPLVNWARREWFTNEPAWDPEYPGLSSLSDELKAKNFILLDYNKNVIGLEPMRALLSRYKPPWAQ
jgi:hypothetical protein